MSESPKKPVSATNRAASKNKKERSRKKFSGESHHAGINVSGSPINTQIPENTTSSAGQDLEPEADSTLTPANQNYPSRPDVSESEKISPEALARGDRPMTVVNHLDELRTRIMVSLAALIISTIILFAASDYMLHFIMKPYLDAGQKLNIFTLSGGFIVRLKIAFASSVLICLPLILFQIWSYIRPAVKVENKNIARVSLISFVLLFYAGITFVFFFIVPMAVKVFIGFIGENIVCTIGANDYLLFVGLLCFSMGFLCEFPIVVLILTNLGILSPSFLIKNRKYSIVLIWVVAAIMTPRDVLSQILVAIPLMGLYEISIIISKFSVIRKKRKELLKAARDYRAAGTA